MDWTQLLDPRRLCRPDYADAPNRPAYLQDYDRILFSEPFRRLAQKTQVHPLHDHDHVHHRMIHSMETSSVGRSLGIQVGEALVADGRLAKGQQHVMAGTVQAACLVHDIGNPPFGHSGEASIGAWFTQQFAANDGQGAGLAAGIATAHRAEFEAFEGNAQGLRIVSRLEMARRAGGMRLSYATLGAFAKYPCTARAAADATTPYVGLKKFGTFASEEALFAEAATALGLPEERPPAGHRWWRRHPLAFLVEAADDICYRILDLEDAATVGDLDSDVVSGLLEDITGKPNRAPDPEMTLRDRTGMLRAMAIGSAIDSAVAAFLDNYDAIMAGTFDDGLMEVSSKAGAFARLKDISNARIFTAQRKTELEIVGRKVLFTILDEFHALFLALRACGWNVDRLLNEDAYRARLIRAVDLDLRGVEDDYTAAHALTDFVSGMTDRYALRVRDMISGQVTR
ncbi:dGTP triphosphohydrolase [Tritonibacter horizontis]|uniref:Deoxyguanosinetriphosphate triphosphohydrolase n=1 Tax=Tritonibacter horizontis TaxID=1768241 RepID=A0A132C0T5_9RHOB|nr:dNTP triphosphohydrolase [Tritonibacter horizontis]KUP94146.1 deoxyguanosinetriphosphate triphosphohydrolase [Tritonibacter horizontis]